MSTVCSLKLPLDHKLHSPIGYGPSPQLREHRPLKNTTSRHTTSHTPHFVRHTTKIHQKMSHNNTSHQSEHLASMAHPLRPTTPRTPLMVNPRPRSNSTYTSRPPYPHITPPRERSYKSPLQPQQFENLKSAEEWPVWARQVRSHFRSIGYGDQLDIGYESRTDSAKQEEILSFLIQKVHEANGFNKILIVEREALTPGYPSYRGRVAWHILKEHYEFVNRKMHDPTSDYMQPYNTYYSPPPPPQHHHQRLRHPQPPAIPMSHNHFPGTTEYMAVNPNPITSPNYSAHSSPPHYNTAFDHSPSPYSHRHRSNKSRSPITVLRATSTPSRKYTHRRSLQKARPNLRRT